jgi:hypothetical protein
MADTISSLKFAASAAGYSPQQDAVSRRLQAAASSRDTMDESNLQIEGEAPTTPQSAHGSNSNFAAAMRTHRHEPATPLASPKALQPAPGAFPLDPLDQSPGDNNNATAGAPDEVEAVMRTMTIVLDREEQRLGISIAGGTDEPVQDGDSRLYISQILPEGAVARDGRLRVGDCILAGERRWWCCCCCCCCCCFAP